MEDRPRIIPCRLGSTSLYELTSILRMMGSYTDSIQGSCYETKALHDKVADTQNGSLGAAPGLRITTHVICGFSPPGLRCRSPLRRIRPPPPSTRRSLAGISKVNRSLQALSRLAASFVSVSRIFLLFVGLLVIGSLLLWGLYMGP